MLKLFITGDPNYKHKEQIVDLLLDINHYSTIEVANLNEGNYVTSVVETFCDKFGIPSTTYHNHLYDGFAGRYENTIKAVLTEYNPDIIIAFNNGIDNNEITRKIKKLTNKPIIWR